MIFVQCLPQLKYLLLQKRAYIYWKRKESSVLSSFFLFLEQSWQKANIMCNLIIVRAISASVAAMWIKEEMEHKMLNYLHVSLKKTHFILSYLFWILMWSHKPFINSPIMREFWSKLWVLITSACTTLWILSEACLRRDLEKIYTEYLRPPLFLLDILFQHSEEHTYIHVHSVCLWRDTYKYVEKPMEKVNHDCLIFLYYNLRRKTVIISAPKMVQKPE